MMVNARAVEGDRASEDAVVAAEAPPPKIVGDDGVRVGAFGQVVRGGEEAADGRADAEDVEIVARDVGGGDDFGG